MKRNIIILASALLIFLATLAITSNYMVSETVHETDRINEMQVRDLGNAMDYNLQIREQAVHNFLAGIIYYNIEKKNGIDDTSVYITDNEIPSFFGYVYKSLNDFLKLNPYILSAGFFVEPSVYPQMGKKGFAPTRKQGDPHDYNIVDEFDFLNSESYRELRNSHHCAWRLPSLQSPYAGKTIVYYVPIARQNGDFFGVFTINVSLDILRNGLAQALPYGNDNSFILTLDNDDHVILSTDSSTSRFKLITTYHDILHDGSESATKTKDSIHHDIVKHLGNDFFVYHSMLKHAPWYNVIACSTDAIYENVIKTRNVILIVSAIGMLLMLLCCIVVFWDSKKHLERKAAVEQELRTAAKVQQALLKSEEYSMDNIHLNAFMRPAREAGGDLYDYVERDGKLIFCVGDVSGKGMPAALFMTQVVSLFRNAALSYDEPDEIATQINSVLSDNNPEMTFCTLFVGVINLGDRYVTYCNAGHNPPIIIPHSPSSDGDSASVDDNSLSSDSDSSSSDYDSLAREPYFVTVNTNVAIGLMEDFPYMSETFDLNPGDTLLLYTDGVNEAKNAAEEFFGDDRLLAAAKTPTTANILTALDAFVNGNEQSDDITIMTVHNS